MAAHSWILTWETSWTEEPGGLQPMGSQRVRHDLVTEQQLNPIKSKKKIYLHLNNKKSIIFFLKTLT